MGDQILAMAITRRKNQMSAGGGANSPHSIQSRCDVYFRGVAADVGRGVFYLSPSGTSRRRRARCPTHPQVSERADSPLCFSHRRGTVLPGTAGRQLGGRGVDRVQSTRPTRRRGDLNPLGTDRAESAR